MTNAQLYAAVGVPVALNAILNGALFLAALQRMNRIERKLGLLAGKVGELENGIVRVKERLGMQ